MSCALLAVIVFRQILFNKFNSQKKIKTNFPASDHFHTLSLIDFLLGAQKKANINRPHTRSLLNEQHAPARRCFARAISVSSESITAVYKIVSFLRIPLRWTQSEATGCRHSGSDNLSFAAKHLAWSLRFARYSLFNFSNENTLNKCYTEKVLHRFVLELDILLFSSF